MRSRVLVLTALAVVLLAPAVSLAQMKPTFVLRVASVDTLSAKGKYLAKMIDQADNYEQIEGFLKAFTGPQGIDGLDTTKPLGVYGKLGPNGLDSEVVVLIPVSDGDKFMDFLKKQNLSFDKQKNGAFKFDIPGSPLPAFLRVANGYVYVTLQNDDAIEVKNLAEPKTVLVPDQIGIATLIFDIEQIPQAMKALALQAIEDQAREQKNKLPKDLPDAEKRSQTAGIDLATAMGKGLLTDGGAVSFVLDLDEPKQEMKVGMSFAGKPGSGLAKSLADLGKASSVTAALPAGGTVAANLNASLPASIRDLLVAEAEKGLKEGLAKETDDRKKKAGQLLSDALMPTLKAGDIDVGMSLVPTAGGKHNAVFALRVVKGSSIEKAVKEVVALLNDQEKRAVGLNIDLDKADGVNIHGAKGGEMDANGKKIFGESNIHFAVRDDALLLAFGDGSLSAVRTAIAGKPKPGAIAGATLNVSKFLALLPEAEAKRVKPALEKALAGAPQGKDIVTLTLEGGKELKLNLTVPAPVIRFLAEAAKLAGRGA